MKEISQTLQAGFDARKLRPHINELKAGLRALDREFYARNPVLSSPLTAGVMHPFKLYVLPRRLRGAAAADDWRKITVRSGLVGRLAVTGTDAVADPYSGVLPDDDSAEITIPTGQSAHYFWIEYTPGATPSPTATIEHSDDPEANGWPGFDAGMPCTDEGVICLLLGWVDTDTDEALKIARIRQIACVDLPNFYQACVRVGETDKVINVACDGPPFIFV